MAQTGEEASEWKNEARTDLKKKKKKKNNKTFAPEYEWKTRQGIEG